MATAPDIATLYAYESEILPAWVQVLRDRGVNAFLQFSTQTKNTPFTDVFIEHVVPTGHQHYHSDGRLYWDAWEGWLIQTVFSERDNNSNQQASILKAIRSAAFDFEALLDDTVLAYHNVMFIKESPQGSGLNSGFNTTLFLDWTILPFKIQFAARADSWP